MAATMTQTAHASVSAFWNVRSQLERTNPEYRNSFDTLACTLGPYKLWNTVNEVSNIFNNDLHPELRNHLNEKRSSIRPPRQYRGPREPRNALRCYMVGLTQDRASPHVAILCKEKWFCTQARQVILESGLLQDRGWVGCIRLPFEIRQNGATSPVPKSTVGLPASQESTTFRRDQHNIAISYNPESTSGLRIAISGLNGNVRMATLGGIIEINGALFGLSVSHVFSAQTLSYDGTGSEHDSDTESLVPDQDDLDPFVRTNEFDKVPDVAETYPEPAGKLNQASETENEGLYPGVGEDIVDPFMGQHGDTVSPKWCLGSRETFGNEAAYDFEWALISQDGDDGPIKPDTMINSFKTNLGERLSISSVINEMAPAGTHLLLRAPRGGITVTAIGSETSLQLASSSQYLRLWTVRMDRAEDGDCGSWIVDHVTGELFGMLVATCEAVCEAYILPIKDILVEIETSSGHLARLPALDLITGIKETKETEIASMEDSKVKRDTISESTDDLSLLYQSLQADNIRVLKLLPALRGDVVQCELSIRSLGGPRDYEALFYTLTAHESTSRIIVNDQSISVNSNLASALDDLRHFYAPRFLWVDTLCINAGNVVERNSQVALLAPILLQARGVCIWLGPGDIYSEWAFSSYNSNFDREEPKLFRRLAIILGGILPSVWFRTNVVAAICLARNATVRCGRASMPWKDFVDIVSVLDYEPPPNYSSEERNILSVSLFLVNEIKNSIRWLDNRKIERRYSLEYLVRVFSWVDTVNAHDSIYSLLSLASDVYPLPKSSVTSSAKDFPHEPAPLKAVYELSNTPIVPKTAESFQRPLEGGHGRPLIVDYSESFENVCKDFVHSAIQNSQSLDILCIPWAPKYDRLPSWVLDRPQAAGVEKEVSKSQRANKSYFVSFSGGPGILQVYKASGIKPPIVFFSNSLDDAPLLHVKGFTIDATQAVASPGRMGDIPPGWAEFLGWNDINEPTPDKVWRTLVGDRGRSTHTFPPATYQRACGRMFQQMQTEKGLMLSQATHSQDRIIREFAETVEGVVWDRRLIRTAKHSFVGLAPRVTRERDIIAILYGLSVPVVLRQIHGTPDGDNLFILVGECFIYGMMDGEALGFKEEHGIQDQTFVLR